MIQGTSNRAAVPELANLVCPEKICRRKQNSTFPNQHCMQLHYLLFGRQAFFRMTVLVQDHFYSDNLNLHVTSQAIKQL